MSAWRPIATEPKGKVLLFFPPDMSGRIKQGAMWSIGNAHEFPFRQPTHWQPLTVPE